MRHQPLGRVAGFVSVFFLLSFSACDSGPEKTKVSGTVTFKGQPVKAGTISFLNAKTNTAVGGASIKDGQYEVPAQVGLQPGSYKVSINYPDPSVQQDDEAPGESKPVPELLPKQYNSETTLTAEVKPGSEPINFDLK